MCGLFFALWQVSLAISLTRGQDGVRGVAASATPAILVLRLQRMLAMLGANVANVQICEPDAFRARLCNACAVPLNASSQCGHVDMRFSLSIDRSVVL